MAKDETMSKDKVKILIILNEDNEKIINLRLIKYDYGL